MSKTKKAKAPFYELLYIVSNKFTEEELKPINAKIEKIITENGGQVQKITEWGNKKLAYPIQHCHHGYYTLVEFTAPGEKMQKIGKVIGITEEVLRHQIVIKEVKAEEEASRERTRAKEWAVKTKEDEKKKNELEKEKTRGKVDLKELDKKLDKILETDDLL